MTKVCIKIQIKKSVMSDILAEKDAIMQIWLLAPVHF